ncbi:MAG: hypothetical protein ACOYJU_03840 [Anaerovoracaceae bacterium]|jgi:Ni/Fe-hydrogenase subunit HybB-like protein
MQIFDWIIFLLSILIFAAGGIFMVHQMFFGLNKTALNDKYVWGVNIQGFTFLSSAGMGILAMSAIPLLVMGRQEDSLWQLPGSIALGCIVCAQVLMGADLGRPFRALKILKGKNLISPLTLDFLILFLLTISALFLSFDFLLGYRVICLIWAWGTMFLCFFGFIVHGLLFVPRVGSGYQSEPFATATFIASGCAMGSGLMVALCWGTAMESWFTMAFSVAAAFALACGLGSVICDLLGDQRPHQLFFALSALIVCGILFMDALLLPQTRILVPIAIGISLVGGFVEKHQAVIHLQKKPILPYPYSAFEQKILYKPVLSEWLNLVSGVAGIVAIMYVIRIVHQYILPWIWQLLA